MPITPTASPKVDVASTGKDAQRFLKLPIGAAKPKPRVAMTLPAVGQAHACLPDLRPGDRLLVSAELELTTDCPQQQSDCVKTPYDFNPEVEVRLLLAAGPNVEEPGGRARQLGLLQRRRITHQRHHDVFVFDTVEYQVPQGGLPWSGASVVNATIAAWHPRAKPGHVLIVGQQNPGGNPSGDMCGISVTRFRPGAQPQPNPLRTEQRQIETLPVITGKPQKAVVYSQRLDDLEEGEHLRVRGELRTSSAHLGYPVRTTAEVFLATDPTAISPGREAKRVCPDGPQISRGNGKNTLPADAPLRSPKTGVKRIVKDANVPLYVNLMIVNGDPTHQAGAADALAIVPEGFLAVTRYPA